VLVIDAPVPPLLWAFGRPMVIIPEAFVRSLDARTLGAVLAHELAHLIYYLREFSPRTKILGGSAEVSDQMSEVRRICQEALASS
jgi:hypothetical protein